MSLNENDVINIAHLARIDINSEEASRYAEDLSNILEMVDQLQAAPTNNIQPLSNPLEQKQRLRADQVTESNQREKLQENANAIEDGLYLVPKVID